MFINIFMFLYHARATLIVVIRTSNKCRHAPDSWGLDAVCRHRCAVTAL
jgi:hypothetical protein